MEKRGKGYFKIIGGEWRRDGKEGKCRERKQSEREQKRFTLWVQKEKKTE